MELQIQYKLNQQPSCIKLHKLDTKPKKVQMAFKHFRVMLCAIQCENPERYDTIKDKTKHEMLSDSAS